MGVGFVIFAPGDDKTKQEIEKARGFELGHVEKGEKRVIVEPKNIEYKE